MTNKNQQAESRRTEPPPLPSAESPTSHFPLPPMPPTPTTDSEIIEYVRAFDKPLTKDEKAAWIVEITLRTLQGELPQDVYPTLRSKIESLPEIEPTEEREEEKLPSGKRIGLSSGPASFADASSFHVYEQKKFTRQQDSNDRGFIFKLIFSLLFLGIIAYGIGYWTIKKTTVHNKEGVPLDYNVRAAFSPKTEVTDGKTSSQREMETSENNAAISKPFRQHAKLENPFDDEALTENPFLGDF